MSNSFPYMSCPKTWWSFSECDNCSMFVLLQPWKTLKRGLWESHGFRVFYNMNKECLLPCYMQYITGIFFLSTVLDMVEICLNIFRCTSEPVLTCYLSIGPQAQTFLPKWKQWKPLPHTLTEKVSHVFYNYKTSSSQK